jgi:pimeloyl-ACP methyl ester carboxylesterase
MTLAVTAVRGNRPLPTSTPLIVSLKMFKLSLRASSWKSHSLLDGQLSFSSISLEEYLCLVLRSLGGAINADIAANFPHPLPFSGLISLSGLPFLNSTVLPNNIQTPLLNSLIFSSFNNTDVTLALNTRIALGNATSAKLDQIPFSTLSNWLGATLFLTPALAQLVSGRQTDPTRFFEEGQAGFPFLIIYGKEDRLLNGTAVIELFESKNFTNMESHLLDGAGHISFFDKEKESARILLTWIENVRSGNLPNKSK